MIGEGSIPLPFNVFYSSLECSTVEKRVRPLCVLLKILPSFTSLLRAAEIGITMQDLDLLSVGMLFDIFTEKSYDLELNETDKNDTRDATQEEIESFVENF